MAKKEFGFMSKSQQKQNDPHLLLNTILIILETVFTLVLKHDRVIALQAKKFVENQITIKINSYIPFFDIYVQFTEHGILFDSTAPQKAVDLDVRTTLVDLLKIFLMGNTKSIRAMRIDGDRVLQDEFRDLLSLFSIMKILSDWQQWLQQPVNEESIETSKKRIAPLLDKIDYQRTQINELYVEVKQYKNRIKRIQRRQKIVNFTFGAVILLFVVIFVYNMWL